MNDKILINKLKSYPKDKLFIYSDRSVNPIKIDEYLKSICENDQEFMQELFSKLVHIKYDEFVSSLKVVTQKFLNIINYNFKVYCQYNEFHSEHWILAHIIDDLTNNKYFNGFFDFESVVTDFNEIYVVFDDYMFTGGNVIKTYDNLQYEMKMKKIDCRKLRKIIVVPFVTDQSIECIKVNMKEFFDKPAMIIYDKILRQTLNAEKYDYFHIEKTYKYDTEIGLVPAYFDHSIHNHTGLAVILSGINGHKNIGSLLNNPVDRIHINMLKSHVHSA